MASHPTTAPTELRRTAARWLPPTAFALLFLLSGSGLPVLEGDQEPLPPDLRLDWIVGAQVSPEAPPLRGSAGDPATVSVRLRNIGGTDAFAVIVEARTALGRLGRPRRFEPGPAAGGSRRFEQSLTLASGMRELCFEARLQNLAGGEQHELNLDDNQICRSVEIQGKRRTP